MSNCIAPTDDQCINFIELVLIPSFAPHRQFSSYQEREEWMKEVAGTDWDADTTDDLITMYSVVTNMKEAKEELAELKAESKISYICIVY